MKYIVAIIQPDRLDEVLRLLTEKEIHLATVSTVVGRGRQKGIAEVYRRPDGQRGGWKNICHGSSRLHSHPYGRNRQRSHWLRRTFIGSFWS